MNRCVNNTADTEIVFGIVSYFLKIVYVYLSQIIIMF